MIASDIDYQKAVAGLRAGPDPLRAEVETYERARRGEIGTTINLEGIGGVLVALRIAANISQGELARRLGVSKQLVARDEMRSYRSVTVERAARVLQALGVRLESRLLDPLAAQVPDVVKHRAPLDEMIERLAHRWPELDGRLARVRSGDPTFLAEARMLDVLVREGRELEPIGPGFRVDGGDVFVARRAARANADVWLMGALEDIIGEIHERPIRFLVDLGGVDDRLLIDHHIGRPPRWAKAVDVINAEAWFRERARATDRAH